MPPHQVKTINYGCAGVGVGPGVGVSGPILIPLNYAKLHTPQMKSIYWRHFGFPTNENNCIITKQHVVCIMCLKVLTNHGNTTNLRAHLQYRHKEVFKRIIEEHGIKVPPRKNQSKNLNHSNSLEAIQHQQRRQCQKQELIHHLRQQQQHQQQPDQDHYQRHIYTKRLAHAETAVGSSSLLSDEDVEIGIQETKIKIEFSDHSQSEDTSMSNATTALVGETMINDGSLMCGRVSMGGDGTGGTEGDQNVIYETSIPITYDDEESIEGKHFTKIEVIGCNDMNGINGIDEIEIDQDDTEIAEQQQKKLLIANGGNVATVLTPDEGGSGARCASRGVTGIRSQTITEANISGGISSTKHSVAAVTSVSTAAISVVTNGHYDHHNNHLPSISSANSVIDTTSVVNTINSTTNSSSTIHNTHTNRGDGTPVVAGANHHNKNVCRDIVDLYEFQDVLVNLVILDLHNVSTLYEPGMTQFLRMLTPNIRLPSIERMELFIREMYSDKHTTVSAQMRSHSHSKSYTLSFEFWTNIEQKQFVSIYFNYINESTDYSLNSNIFGTFEYNKFLQFEIILENFNLNNCSAAILNCDNNCDYLRNFLQTKGIPWIMSFDTIVDRCLRNVFQLESVVVILDEIKDVIMRHSTEIRSKGMEIPIINDEYPWTYYELLKFFTESISWPEDNEILVSSAKSIMDVLQTLVATEDILKAEDAPLCSMLAPITTKVLSKKLTPSTIDDAFTITLKATVIEVFEKYILGNDHFFITALLDPRFHRLIIVDDIDNCVQLLTNKLLRLEEENKLYSEYDSNISTSVKPLETTIACETHLIMPTKKSNLELFFDMTDNTNGSNDMETNAIENDLKRYRTEVHVSLDESPFVWWQKAGSMYGSLKRLASHCQCAPCTVKPNFRKPLQEQINDQQKRFALKGSLIDPVLFLHFNQNS